MGAHDHHEGQEPSLHDESCPRESQRHGFKNHTVHIILYSLFSTFFLIFYLFSLFCIFSLSLIPDGNTAGRGVRGGGVLRGCRRNSEFWSSAVFGHVHVKSRISRRLKLSISPAEAVTHVTILVSHIPVHLIEFGTVSSDNLV